MTEATDSPHLTASNIKGSFHVGCAESDHWAPVEMINQLEGYVSEHAPKVEWNGTRARSTASYFQIVLANIITKQRSVTGTDCCRCFDNT